MVDGQCMKLFCHNKTWDEADAHCKAKGGRLGRILNNIRNDWILNSVYPKSVWFGGSRKVDNNWMDSAGYPLIYTNWAPTQPDHWWKPGWECILANGINRWGSQMAATYWGDHPCDERFCHICEDNAEGKILSKIEGRLKSKLEIETRNRK